MDALDDLLTFDFDHLGKERDRPGGGAAAQMALATFGPHQLAAAGDPETLGRSLVCLKFLLPL